MSQNIDFTQLTVAQLKDHLRAIKGKLGGKKAELIERLQIAYGQIPAPQVAPPVPQPPAGYAPAMAPPVQAPLPTQPTTKPKTTKPKAPAKNPSDSLKSAVRDADLPFDVALAALLESYGATDRYGALIESVQDLSENKPVPLAVPHTAEALSALKVADLKKILKDQGKKVGGKKDELVARILAPVEDAPAKGSVKPDEGGIVLPELAPMPPGIGAAPVVDYGATTDPMDADTVEDVPPVPGVPEGATSPVGSLPPGLPVGLPTTSSPPLPTGLPTTSSPPLPSGLPTVASPAPSGLPTGLPTVASPAPSVPGLPTVASPAPPSGLPLNVALPTVPGASSPSM